MLQMCGIILRIADMFTGIIERRGTVRSAKKSGLGLRLTIAKPRGWRIQKGASIAVDGVCLTSIGSPGSDLVFELMGETLSKTIAATYRRGSLVNIERPMRASSEIGGHFVQGHVDARARVRRIEKRRYGAELEIEIPPKFRRLVAEVGSIAINGVSLTVSKKRGNAVVVSLIPHTLEVTNLAALNVDDVVNVEFDVLARYLAARNER
jgi:riboflavin synthase